VPARPVTFLDCPAQLHDPASAWNRDKQNTTHGGQKKRHRQGQLAVEAEEVNGDVVGVLKDEDQQQDQHHRRRNEPHPDTTGPCATDLPRYPWFVRGRRSPAELVSSARSRRLRRCHSGRGRHERLIGGHTPTVTPMDWPDIKIGTNGGTEAKDCRLRRSSARSPLPEGPASRSAYRLVMSVKTTPRGRVRVSPAGDGCGGLG
jgi:hypothetical protein